MRWAAGSSVRTPPQGQPGQGSVCNSMPGASPAACPAGAAGTHSENRLGHLCEPCGCLASGRRSQGKASRKTAGFAMHCPAGRARGEALPRATGSPGRPHRGQPGYWQGSCLGGPWTMQLAEAVRAIGKAPPKQAGTGAKARRGRPGPWQGLAAAGRAPGDALPRPAGPEARHCLGRPGPRQGFAEALPRLPSPRRSLAKAGRILGRALLRPAGPSARLRPWWQPWPRRGLATGPGPGEVLPRSAGSAALPRGRPGPRRCRAEVCRSHHGMAGPMASGPQAWHCQGPPGPRQFSAIASVWQRQRQGIAQGGGPWQCHAARAGAPAKPG